MKDEYLLPIIADEMLKSGYEYGVLPADDQWFGLLIKRIKRLWWRALGR